MKDTLSSLPQTDGYQGTGALQNGIASAALHHPPRTSKYMIVRAASIQAVPAFGASKRAAQIAGLVRSSR